MNCLIIITSFMLCLTVNCIVGHTIDDIVLFVNNVGHYLQAKKNFTEDDVKFILYTRKNPAGYRLHKDDIKNLRHSSYNSSHPTKVIIHGYKNSYSSPAVQLPKDAYLSTGEYNVIAVDWQLYAKFYFPPNERARVVGHGTGSMLSYLKNKGGLKFSDLHVIGHSLGAHAAGFVTEKTKLKPARITGLDPASPQFSQQPPSERLGEEDAEYVDIIHTSIEALGIPENIGHVDFYPAGGKNQPRCRKQENIIGRCDHGESYVYFAESIRNKNKFPAVKCKSLHDALRRNCNGESTAIMGESTIVRKPRGIYYVDEVYLGK